MSKPGKSITDLIIHLHPRTVPEETLKFTLSWGLGGMAVVLIGLLFLSGILLLLVYQPITESAYASIMRLIHVVPFGPWLRNIHHWCANLLVMVAVLHLLRVFLLGAFGPGRRLNWIVGLFLLFLLLLSNFTGYLLPWDQLAYWAVTICTGMLGYIPVIGQWLQELFRGGSKVGPSTLANFYVLHVAFIPGLLSILMLWHFWLVRRAGGLIRKSPDTVTKLRRIPTVPHLIVREAAVGLTLMALVLVFSIFLDAPLQEQANPAITPNPAKAPWYFLGFQELLLHLHPVFAVFVWPLLSVALLLLIPFWQWSALPAGVWFGSTRGRSLAGWSTGISALFTLMIILVDDLLTNAKYSISISDTFITRGLLPTVAVISLMVGLYHLLVRKLKYRRSEVVMAGFIVLLVSLTVCTAIGIWFRGPEMRLGWT